MTHLMVSEINTATTNRVETHSNRKGMQLPGKYKMKKFNFFRKKKEKLGKTESKKLNKISV